MRDVPRLFVMLSVLVGATSHAGAQATMAVDGQVIATASRWTSDGSRIVTEATVRTPDGDVTVSQLGGSVDGLAMRTFPGPAIMMPGMRVAVTAHPALDLAQRTHVVVDGVRVLAEAPGFVRTGPTASGKYLYWESGCVYVNVDAEGTKEIAGANEFPVIDSAIAAWNDGTRGCSYMNLVRDPKLENLEVSRDNVNVIKFRDLSWCRPALGDDPARCYSPAAAGLTTAVFVDDSSSKRDGAIVDADVELNGVDFAISAGGETLGTAGCKSDLANTLTHELGHLLGLEHPCRAAGDPPRTDGEGNTVPSCGGANDPEILEATMYNFQECGETKKATLSADDTAAICAIYPTGDDPGTCSRVTDEAGCCSASEEPPVPALALAGLTVAVLAVRRRSRKNSARG